MCWILWFTGCNSCFIYGDNLSCASLTLTDLQDINFDCSPSEENPGLIFQYREWWLYDDNDDDDNALPHTSSWFGT
jgi:hypothetical protein